MSIFVVIQKQKNVLFAGLFATLFIAIALVIFFIIKNRFSSEQTTDSTVYFSNNTQFPLIKNTIDLHAFTCEVKELIYDDYVLTNGIIIKLSAKCIYLDRLEKKQEVIVPIVQFNPNNNHHLIARKLHYGDLSQWKDSDFIHSIEEKYYYEHGTDVPIYEKPEPLKYWQETTNKPTLDAGDKLLIEIGNKDSDIYLTKNDFNGDYIESALFNKDYHENVYTYESLTNFLTTGKPDDIKLENNLLIPNFVQYIEDVNPS